MWLEVDEDLPEHPKSLRLCASLGNPLGWAYVIKLWRWCVKFAPSGDLTSFGAEELEYGLGWNGERDQLYAALKFAGFIEDSKDGRIVVHDWMDHQGRALKKMENDRKRQKKFRKARPRDVTQSSALRPTDIRVTSPVPNLTKPNLTKPEEEEPAQVPSEPSAPPLLVFPCSGTKPEWNLTEDWVTEAKAAYPGLDVPGEMRKALAKIKTGACRKPTARGMSRFLMTWLGTANDRGPHSKPPVDDGRCDWHKRGNRGKASFRPLDSCPECKHVRAYQAVRTSEPTPIAAIPQRDWAKEAELWKQDKQAKGAT